MEGTYKRIGERIKILRQYMGLTQEQVANILCLGRDAILKIEQGSRKITADEIAKFSKLYSISADELIAGEKFNYNDEIVFARGFGKLNENDRIEILKLIEFKNNLKKQPDENV